MMNKYYDSMLKSSSLFDTLCTIEGLYSTPYTSRARIDTNSSTYRMEEKNNELHLSVDLPGVKAKDLAVQTTGQNIKVTGKLRGEDFKYSYVVSKDYDPETISAIYEDGVLILTLGKTSVTKTKTVEIKSRQ